jgi:hypothetical protein
VSTYTKFFTNRFQDTGKFALEKLLMYGPKLAILKNVYALKLEREKSNEFDTWHM